jgi:Zn-dependent protease with chaperone function
MASAGNHGVYYSELKAYKKAPASKEMFDEWAHSGLAKIQRDITTHKNLTFFQRFIRSAFLGLDVILVTPETLPKLYEYVDGICQKANIATPTIFVTRHDGFFNAAAQKLFVSTGGIIVGQQLMHEVSDEALEAIVAHEIGHIKHNHVNKMMALQLVDWMVYFALVKLLSENGRISESRDLFAWIASSFTSPLIINKRFEKEADAFACDNGKAKGIVEFFELMLEKEQLREEEFVAIAELLQKNRSDLSLWSNMTFGLRYSMAKFGHNFGKAFKYIYHNTFLGAHPSPEARIAAAQKYLQQEA